MARYSIWQIGRGLVAETGCEHDAIKLAHQLVRKYGKDVMVRQIYNGRARTRWYTVEKEAMGWV